MADAVPLVLAEVDGGGVVFGFFALSEEDGGGVVFGLLVLFDKCLPRSATSSPFPSKAPLPTMPPIPTRDAAKTHPLSTLLRTSRSKATSKEARIDFKTETTLDIL